MPYRPNAHNPSNVPPEQWQRRGWRLMDADEVGPAFTTPLPLTHRWNVWRWKRRRSTKEMWTASSLRHSYLTKLSRNRIRILRNLHPERLPPHVPAPSALAFVRMTPTPPPVDYARIDAEAEARRLAESHPISHPPITESVMHRKRIRRLEW